MYFEGGLGNLNGEQTTVEQENTAKDDTIQVSILISLITSISIQKSSVKCSNSTKRVEMNGQVLFLSVFYFTLINCFSSTESIFLSLTSLSSNQPFRMY